MLSLDLLSTQLPASTQARYADLRLLRERRVSVALRDGSADVSTVEDEVLTARVLDQAYGVAATNRPSPETVQPLLEQAQSQARAFDAHHTLSPIRPEQGEEMRTPRRAFDADAAQRFLVELRQLVAVELRGVAHQTEAVATSVAEETQMVSTEGTRIRESTVRTDVTVAVVARAMGHAAATKVVGGQGGWELIEAQDSTKLVGAMVKRVRDGLAAQQLSPLSRGSRFTVILDGEAAGALAHELAHLLEADVYQERMLPPSAVAAEFQLVDNPSVPGGYGSHTWDAEGVRGRRKTLLRQEEVRLLHTRLTARQDEQPGNAHGTTHVPRPGMSNVYIAPGDWRTEELFQETRRGLFLAGVLKAETNTATGIIELQPELTYVIDDRSIGTPVRGVRLVEHARSLVQRIHGIAGLASLRPGLEKGEPVGEGAPHLRIDGARCL